MIKIQFGNKTKVIQHRNNNVAMQRKKMFEYL